MIGAGTIISPIIKVVTTVAILGAVYLFIVKPTLDTTEDITKSVNDSIGQSFDSLGGVSPQVKKSVRQAQKLQQQQQQASQQQIQQASKLLSCIQKANNDVDKITACNSRYSP
jgi:predicted PurR-regulated permease PerM